MTYSFEGRKPAILAQKVIGNLDVKPGTISWKVQLNRARTPTDTDHRNFAALWAAGEGRLGSRCSKPPPFLLPDGTTASTFKEAAQACSPDPLPSHSVPDSSVLRFSRLSVADDPVVRRLLTDDGDSGVYVSNAASPPWDDAPAARTAQVKNNAPRSGLHAAAFLQHDERVVENSVPTVVTAYRGHGVYPDRHRVWVDGTLWVLSSGDIVFYWDGFDFNHYGSIYTRVCHDPSWQLPS